MRMLKLIALTSFVSAAILTSSPDSLDVIASGFSQTTCLPARSLFLLGDESGKDFLLRVLKTDDRDARLKALGALEGMLKKDDLGSLRQLAEGKDKLVAVKAAENIIAVRSEQ